MRQAYIDINGRIRARLIEPTSITITRGEGPTDLCRKPITVDSWSGAQNVLNRWCSTVQGKGSDKCDFTIVFPACDWFPDGYTYNGTYGLYHSSVEVPDLAKHVRQHLDFCINPEGMMNKSLAAEARKFLSYYNVEQVPEFLSEDCERQVTYDARDLEWKEARDWCWRNALENWRTFDMPEPEMMIEIYRKETAGAIARTG